MDTDSDSDSDRDMPVAAAGTIKKGDIPRSIRLHEKRKENLLGG